MMQQTPQFLRAVEHTLRIEGGYVNNPVDKGGPTNLGITFNTFNNWMLKVMGRPATLEELRRLDKETARQLYADLYWYAENPDLPCQEIAEWWEPLGEFCFDCRVNHQPQVGGVLLQRALNIINQNEKLFADMKVDGWVGSVTLNAMRSMDGVGRGRERLMVAAVAYRFRYMLEIGEHNPSQETFMAGWLFRVAGFIPK